MGNSLSQIMTLSSNAKRLVGNNFPNKECIHLKKKIAASQKDVILIISWYVINIKTYIRDSRMENDNFVTKKTKTRKSCVFPLKKKRC